jgi:hypothetical protein
MLALTPVFKSRTGALQMTGTAKGVVGQDGTPVLSQEFDPVYLVRIESIFKLSHSFSPL